MSEESRVLHFYNHQTIFLTGATGFIGKVVLEKLLWVCPQITKIYVLVRPKKGKSRKERFEQLFESPCFNRLKNERNDFKKQVYLIEGDCDESDLGLDEHDRLLLISEVTMVIHAAANVKFEQTLKAAAFTLKAAMEIVELCKQMPKLTALVYVSTAFSNCLHSHIKEDFYKPPMGAEVFLALTQALDEERLEAITSGLLGAWPNTYVYVKSIIEDYLRRNCDGLPVAIVRPSIVVSAIRDPIPGWSDSIYGPMGIAMAANLGVLRSLHAIKNVKAHMVTVDTVCNVILLAGWKVATDVKSKMQPITIFNAVTEDHILYTWDRFLSSMYAHMWLGAMSNQLWYNTMSICESKFRHDVIIFFGHTVVSFIVDAVLWLLGRERLAVKNYVRLNKLLDLTSYFTTRYWRIDRNNVDQINSELNETERDIFKVTHEDLNVPNCMRDAVLCFRANIMKEPMDTLTRARAKLVIFGILHYTFLAILFYGLFRLVYNISQYVWQAV